MKKDVISTNYRHVKTYINLREQLENEMTWINSEIDGEVNHPLDANVRKYFNMVHHGFA